MSSNVEILSLIVTALCLISFCLVFTFLFRHYYLSNIDEIKKGNADQEILELEIEERKKKTRKHAKAIKITKKVVGYGLFAIVLVIFGFSLYGRFFNNNLSFGNSGLIVISTGSMSEKNESNDYLFDNNLNNQFNAYDVISVTKYDSPEDVKQYDVIAYKNTDGIIIVHRVIEIREANGENVFITRGDANNTSDTNFQYENYLTFDNIIGYYNGTRVPLIGVFVIFLQSNAGIITIVAIAYCLIMFDHYNSKFDEALLNRTKYISETLKYDYDNVVKFETFNENITLYNNKIYTFVDGTIFEEKEANEENLKIYNDKKALVKIDEKESRSEEKPCKTNFFSKSFEQIKNKFTKKDKSE